MAEQKKQTLNFQEAIRKIEERGDFNRYAELKPVFEDKLERLRPGDHTERGLCYYYLLVSYMKANLVHETQESINFYEKMDDAFTKQLEVYRDDKDKVYRSELLDFFRLMERCYGSLELLYTNKHFNKRRKEAYRRKMEFRKHDHRARRKWWSWFEYRFLETTSAYGTSIGRWAGTIFIFALMASLGYFVIDLFVAQELRTVPVTQDHWFDYLYFAVITLTTVGFGDIAPLALPAKALAVFESFFGFLMLGIFIGLIQKKL